MVRHCGRAASAAGQARLQSARSSGLRVPGRERKTAGRMTLADHVSIARRFQRSIRLDTDLTRVDALQGFVCQRSAADGLLGMASQIAHTTQRAFTWTGPYGGGKSSL